MATIEKRNTKDGKTRYRALVRKRGFPAQSMTFERKTDAQQWARSVETAIDERRFSHVAEAKKRTVRELIDRYILEVLPNRPRSFPTRKQQLLWWRDQLGTLKLADLSPDLIVDCRNRLTRRKSRAGEAISWATVNRYLAALSHALNVAVREWRWLNESPMRDVSKLKEPSPRVRFLSEAEREKLLDVCRRSSSKFLYPIVVLALSTGMRKSEILSLKWDDIDFKHERIIIQKAKNDERRAVPLVGKAKAVLEEMFKGGASESELVFPGNGLTGRLDIKKSWYTALRQADISNFRFHDLRHCTASYLAMNGASLPEIASVLGHKTYQMVARYAHLSDDHTTKVVRSMNKKIFLK